MSIGETKEQLRNLQKELEHVETNLQTQLTIVAEEVKGVSKELSFLKGQSTHE